MTTSKSVLIGVIAALAILVAAVSVYVGVTAGSALNGGVSSDRADEPLTEPAPVPPSDPAPSDPPPATSPLTDPPVTASSSPTREPLVTDPPASPDELAVTPTVVRDSDGKACKTSADGTIAGGYPAATCRFWRQGRGLLSGEAVDTGAQRIACQRDLDIENPVYTAKQKNTWWMWTRSDDGTWDWFPATAVAEGASDQSINGVALCEQ